MAQQKTTDVESEFSEKMRIERQRLLPEWRISDRGLETFVYCAGALIVLGAIGVVSLDYDRQFSVGHPWTLLGLFH